MLNSRIEMLKFRETLPSELRSVICAYQALSERVRSARSVRNFISVLIRDRSAHTELPPALAEYQVLDLRGMPAVAQAERLHDALFNVANESDRKPDEGS
jgi:hypothetical protein